MNQNHQPQPLALSPPVDRALPLVYANGFRIHASPEEVELDFGVENLPSPQGELSARLAISYFTAKRLLFTLHQVIQGYEQRFGVIELDMAKRMAPTQSGGGTPNPDPQA